MKVAGQGPVSPVVEAGGPRGILRVLATGRTAAIPPAAFRVLPTAVPGFLPLVPDRSDLENQWMALRKRLLRETPESSPGVLSEFGKFVKGWLTDHLTPLDRILTFEEWLAGTNYPGHRKAELTRAYEALGGGKPTRVQCRKIQTFVKAEHYPEFKPPRLINSRSDAFKVYSGPIFKSIEQKVYSLKYFVKHATPAQRPVLINALDQGCGSYVGTDYTAFEASFTPELMRQCECQLYTYMVGKLDAAKVALINKTVTGVNNLRTRLGLRVQMTGGRMSGDMCTSLGNSFTNLMIWAFLAHTRGMQESDWDGLVEGDDGLFAVYKGSMPVAEDYAKLGFTIKLEPVERPGEANFCGMCVAGGQCIREPMSVITSLSSTLTQPSCSEKTARELAKAKALSLLWELPQCPIVRAYADRICRDMGDVRARFEEDGFHATPPPEFRAPTRAISWEARELMSVKYGFAPDLQMAVEGLFDSDAPFSEVARMLPPPILSLDMAKYYRWG